MKIAIVLALLFAGCSSFGPEECTDTKHGKLCLPASAKPGVSLKFQGGGDCANTCGTSVSSCDVARDGGGRFLVTISEHACQPSGDVACSDVCKVIAVDCAFPALAAGDYEVIVNGGGTQQLHVADGGAESCTLGSP